MGLNCAMVSNNTEINSLHETNAFSSSQFSCTSKNLFCDNMPGIVHRLESTTFSHLQLFPPLREHESAMPGITYSTLSTRPTISFVRCPCCREITPKMLCVVCAIQQLRVNKVRERYRTLFRYKAELCQKIEKELKPEANFQVDLHSKQRSIKDLKIQIAAKREHLERMHKRIHNIDTNNLITSKNNASLEDKIGKHATRSALLSKSIEVKRDTLRETQKALTKSLTVASIQLLEIFPIEPMTRVPNRANEGKPPDAWRNALQSAKSRRPSYFTVKTLIINDNCNMETLFSEEHCKILILPQKQSKSMLSSVTMGLTASVLALPKTRGCSSRPCRQTLGALLFISKLTELLSVLFDRRLPYSRLRKSWEELCGVYQKEIRNVMTKTSKSAFLMTRFKLNFSILYLCVTCGVPLSKLDFQTPVNNLYSFLYIITGKSPSQNQSAFQNENKKIDNDRILQLYPLPDSFNSKLHLQVVEEFLKIQWEEKRHDFTLDNIEEDWVNVAFSLK